MAGMARPHDQLGLDPVDVGARVRHHAVAALRGRVAPFDRDAGVGLLFLRIATLQTVNARARAVDRAEDFSHWIREGLPGVSRRMR